MVHVKSTFLAPNSNDLPSLIDRLWQQLPSSLPIWSQTVLMQGIGLDPRLKFCSFDKNVISLYEQPTVLTVLCNGASLGQVLPILEQDGDRRKDLIIYPSPSKAKLTLATNLRVTRYTECLLYSLQSLDALFKPNLALPIGARVDVVRDMEDVRKIDRLWPFRDEASLQSLVHNASKGLCVGVFVNDELVAWIVTLRYGGMGRLYTMEGHRGRGYARVCVQMLARKLLSLGLVPFVCVDENNEASKKLFFSMGFRPSQEKIAWVQCHN